MIRNLAIALFIGILLSFAFPPFPTPYLASVAVAFLFWLIYRNNQLKTFAFSRIALLLGLSFVAIGAHWLMDASVEGAFAAFAITGFTFHLVLVLVHWCMRLHPNTLFWSMLAGWIGLEQLQLHWQLDFPWFNLGNSLANFPFFIQYYQWIGATGGTITIIALGWVLFYGLRFLFNLLEQSNKIQKSKGFDISFIFAVSWLIIINFINIHLYLKPLPNAIGQTQTTIVQPNYDPYGTKYQANLYEKQLDTLIRLSQFSEKKSETVVLWPETAIPNVWWLNHAEYNNSAIKINKWLKENPNIKLLTGASTIEGYYKTDSLPNGIVRRTDNDWSYKSYNDALWFYDDTNYAVYHKSKLVSGVEKMPYASILGYFGNAVVDLGGSTELLGTQDTPTVFQSNELLIAPLICYESVYGDFVSNFVKKGANLIAIITNDGWWNNTSGHKQHFAYARLRAIENQRYVIRSANTGISCVINPKGEVEQQLNWGLQGNIKAKVKLFNNQTFYTKHGDCAVIIIGIMALCTMLFYLIKKWI